MGKSTIFREGDFVLVTGSRRMSEDYFRRSFPQVIFGRVLEKIGRDEYLLRVYMKRGKEKLERSHMKASGRHMIIF